MPNTKSVEHFLLVDFGGGYLLSYSCDRGKTESTLSPRPKSGVRQNQILIMFLHRKTYNQMLQI